MAQTKPKAGQFYGVSDNGTDGQFLKTDGTGGMSWDSPITNPTITSIDYPGSATAADPAGGESVIINGTLFASGITCTVGGTSAVTAFNSATQITITTPAKAAGPYTVAVLNPNGGTASQANFIQYSGVPVWSTAAGTLGNVMEGAAASFQVTATEGSDTIEYAVTTGTLPTGLSLATATGAITGTAPAVSADTTTTFSITATDDENQTSSERSFSITVQNDAPSNHFNTVLYTGNETSQNITGVGFNPDFVWMKNRSISSSHLIFDVQRSNNYLIPNSLDAQSSSSSNDVNLITDGFSLSGGGTGSNNNGDDFVSWNFKAGGAAVANTDGTINSQVSVNNTLGFSIVSYTGDGNASADVGHGLSSIPELTIFKQLSSGGTGGGYWNTYYTANNTVGFLNQTNSFATNTGGTNGSIDISNMSTTKFGFLAGSSSVNNQNNSGSDFIVYAFTSKPGFSKVGSYTGNGSTNGTMVQTGFEPAFVMIKSTSSSGTAWNMWDNKRTPYDMLRANASDAEYAGPGRIQFFANGFQLLDADASRNSSGGTYIYLAFAADGSTATPSLANSFATEIYTGNAGASNTTSQSITSVGFKPDLIWIKNRDNANNNVLFDSVKGVTNWLNSNNTNQQYSNSYTDASFLSNGFTTGRSDQTNRNSNDFVALSWKAGGTPSINTDGTTTSIVSANQAAGFSVVQFNSTSAANSTIGHGLSAAPDLVIAKRYDSTGNWAVQVPPLSNGYLLLNSTQALNASDTSIWNATAPTSSVFTAAGGSGKFFNAGSFMSYCFTSIAGYSKVGTYSGTASANSITTGFEPGFIMIKRTDSTGSWVVMDSARGMGSNAYALFPNLNASESNNWNTAFTATGFTISSAEAWINASGGTYIYLAIKEN